MSPKLYSLIELNQEFNIGLNTLKAWKNSGILEPSCKIGTQFRYTEADFRRACSKTLEVKQDEKKTINKRKYNAQVAMPVRDMKSTLGMIFS